MQRSVDALEAVPKARSRKGAAAPRQGAPEPIAALNRVEILEYRQAWTDREAVVDIRTYCPDVGCVTGICPYLRITTADMLNAAQASLPPGYRLRAGTALRTLSMQSSGWDGYFKRMREEHPNWPLSALRRAVNKYFAPYDQKAPPGHCTGGAVDVGLLDPNGESLDLTAPTQGWQAAYTWSDLINPESKANRMLMVEAMLSAGFSNCRDEYWHYSWGDSAWAVRVGERQCPYGWVHPPVALEAHPNSGAVSNAEVAVMRDHEGRILSAEGSCSAVPDDDGAPHLNVGLLWAKGVPTTLRVHGLNASQSAGLVTGDGKSVWEAIQGIEHEGEAIVLHINPLLDRLYITDKIPAAPTE